METENSDITRQKLITWWGSIIGVCAIIVFGSIFVTRSYLIRRDYEIENWRPPYIARLETDLNAVNRDGSNVSLGQLRGKVYVAGYQYTDCPGGCLGMAAYMKTLEEEFGGDPQFRLVSISVNPAEDTPEKMNAWVKEKGVDSEDWWFLTGDPHEIADYMISQFKFFASKEVTDPAQMASQGKFAHDQRLALVDGDANIRGYYDVMNTNRPFEGSKTQGELEFERLRRDLKLVLDPELKVSDLPKE